MKVFPIFDETFSYIPPLILTVLTKLLRQGIHPRNLYSRSFIKHLNVRYHNCVLSLALSKSPKSVLHLSEERRCEQLTLMIICNNIDFYDANWPTNDCERISRKRARILKLFPFAIQLDQLIGKQRCSINASGNCMFATEYSHLMRSHTHSQHRSKICCSIHIVPVIAPQHTICTIYRLSSIYRYIQSCAQNTRQTEVVCSIQVLHTIDADCERDGDREWRMSRYWCRTLQFGE